MVKILDRREVVIRHTVAGELDQRDLLEELFADPPPKLGRCRGDLTPWTWVSSRELMVVERFAAGPSDAGDGQPLGPGPAGLPAEQDAGGEDDEHQRPHADDEETPVGLSRVGS
jgi:hypothetical protein